MFVPISRKAGSCRQKLLSAAPQWQRDSLIGRSSLIATQHKSLFKHVSPDWLRRTHQCAVMCSDRRLAFPHWFSLSLSIGLLRDCTSPHGLNSSALSSLTNRHAGDQGGDIITCTPDVGESGVWGGLVHHWHEGDEEEDDNWGDELTYNSYLWRKPDVGGDCRSCWCDDDEDRETVILINNVKLKTKMYHNHLLWCVMVMEKYYITH